MEALALTIMEALVLFHKRDKQSALKRLFASLFKGFKFYLNSTFLFFLLRDKTLCRRGYKVHLKTIQRC